MLDDRSLAAIVAALNNYCLVPDLTQWRVILLHTFLDLKQHVCSTLLRYQDYQRKPNYFIVQIGGVTLWVARLTCTHWEDFVKCSTMCMLCLLTLRIDVNNRLLLWQCRLFKHFVLLQDVVYSSSNTHQHISYHSLCSCNIIRCLYLKGLC